MLAALFLSAAMASLLLGLLAPASSTPLLTSGQPRRSSRPRGGGRRSERAPLDAPREVSQHSRNSKVSFVGPQLRYIKLRNENARASSGINLHCNAAQKSRHDAQAVRRAVHAGRATMYGVCLPKPRAAARQGNTARRMHRLRSRISIPREGGDREDGVRVSF